MKLPPVRIVSSASLFVFEIVRLGIISKKSFTRLGLVAASVTAITSQSVEETLAAPQPEVVSLSPVLV